MSLPADVARCSGRDPDNQPQECATCLRLLDRSDFPLRVWTAPPEATPCPLRIAAQEPKGA